LTRSRFPTFGLRAQAVRLREETTGFGMATIRVLQ
jgi:hypothetical protein